MPWAENDMMLLSYIVVITCVRGLVQWSLVAETLRPEVVPLLRSASHSLGSLETLDFSSRETRQTKQAGKSIFELVEHGKINHLPRVLLSDEKPEIYMVAVSYIQHSAGESKDRTLL